jgi:hypothetical protein
MMLRMMTAKTMWMTRMNEEGLPITHEDNDAYHRVMKLTCISCGKSTRIHSLEFT